MVLLVSPKVRDRGLFSILRSCLSRRRQLQPQPSPEQKDPRTEENENISEKHLASRRNTPVSNDTDSIVNQLAVLAATIRAPRDSASTSSKYSTSTGPGPGTSTPKPDARLEKEQEIGESFLYLRSLITISQTPEPVPASAPAPEQEPDHPPLRRKRASSRLSLRLDISQLPFTPKVARKPRPRYTTVPPIYAPKPISIRPEVRF